MAKSTHQTQGINDFSPRKGGGQIKTNLNIRINQHEALATEGQSVAAVLISAGHKTFHLTDHGEARSMFCGMGVCYDCLVEINGVPDQRACMTQVQEGMHIRTRVKRS